MPLRLDSSVSHFSHLQPTSGSNKTSSLHNEVETWGVLKCNNVFALCCMSSLHPILCPLSFRLPSVGGYPPPQSCSRFLPVKWIFSWRCCSFWTQSFSKTPRDKTHLIPYIYSKRNLYKNKLNEFTLQPSSLLSLQFWLQGRHFAS